MAPVSFNDSVPFFCFEGAVVSIRFSKVVLVWAVAFFASLVAFNNLTDYQSNFMFVSHVLQMDTTFPENRGMWRAIDATFLHHAFYWLLILTELAVALLCWLGGMRLWRACPNVDRFRQAKGIAVAGLTLGIVLWFTGFLTIGGEWFLMWQSETWNGQQSAFRLAAIFGLVLLYLVQPDGEMKS
jgi:predicted small integral membrane protein